MQLQRGDSTRSMPGPESDGAGAECLRRVVDALYGSIWASARSPDRARTCLLAVEERTGSPSLSTRRPTSPQRVGLAHARGAAFSSSAGTSTAASGSSQRARTTATPRSLATS